MIIGSAECSPNGLQGEKGPNGPHPYIRTGQRFSPQQEGIKIDHRIDTKGNNAHHQNGIDHVAQFIEHRVLTFQWFDQKNDH